MPPCRGGPGIPIRTPSSRPCQVGFYTTVDDGVLLIYRIVILDDGFCFYLIEAVHDVLVAFSGPFKLLPHKHFQK